MQLYTKEEIVTKLKQLSELGWVENGRFGNQGGIGNTVEDYLGIAENNLPIPNAAEWELKTQRANTSALITLFHFEPSPRALKFVARVLLPNYGWRHQEADKLYGIDEMSFRQTINGLSHSDRGFVVEVDRVDRRVFVSFDAAKVDQRHSLWLQEVERRVGLGDLNPQPYWGFDDLEHKAGTKLLNCFYVQADVKKEGDKEYYWYNKVLMLQRFNVDMLLAALETGTMLVDFDARSGHNHGTKFRLRRASLPSLYENVTVIV